MTDMETKWIEAGGDAVGVQESGIKAHVIVRVRSPDNGVSLREDEALAYIAEIHAALMRNKARHENM